MMPDGSAPRRYNKDVDTKINFDSPIKYDDATVMKVRDAWRKTLENKGAGIEEYAATQKGVRATIKLDFHSRQFRDEVAQTLGQSDLTCTFMFVSTQNDTIDLEIEGNLSEVLNDVASALQTSGSDIYIQANGGEHRIKKVAEDDVMAALSMWIMGRMSGKIAPDVL